jgi:hypothetical protein
VDPLLIALDFKKSIMSAVFASTFFFKNLAARAATLGAAKLDPLAVV